eukprot:TRINITY_DN910_c0_g1_i1.p1 TRINITY_DN910_c0_g1~~TRINITY_DN910_c0_g1_i1.p1  ORF type:complete len:590 (-),score=171.91 TRINITY_DN910_c0_g1_i1:545-2314(-)
MKSAVEKEEVHVVTPDAESSVKTEHVAVEEHEMHKEDGDTGSIASKTGPEPTLSLQSFLENMFSVRSLQRHPVLRSKMDDKLSVDVKDVLNIAGIEEYTATEDDVLQCASKSSTLEVIGGTHRIRSKLLSKPVRSTILIYDVQAKDVEEKEVRDLFGELAEKIVEVVCSEGVLQSWNVKFGTEADASAAHSKLVGAKLRDGRIRARIKSEVIIPGPDDPSLAGKDPTYPKRSFTSTGSSAGYYAPSPSMYRPNPYFPYPPPSMMYYVPPGMASPQQYIPGREGGRRGGPGASSGMNASGGYGYYMYPGGATGGMPVGYPAQHGGSGSNGGSSAGSDRRGERFHPEAAGPHQKKELGKGRRKKKSKDRIETGREKGIDSAEFPPLRTTSEGLTPGYASDFRHYDIKKMIDVLSGIEKSTIEKERGVVLEPSESTKVLDTPVADLTISKQDLPATKETGIFGLEFGKIKSFKDVATEHKRRDSMKKDGTVPTASSTPPASSHGKHREHRRSRHRHGHGHAHGHGSGHGSSHPHDPSSSSDGKVDEVSVKKTEGSGDRKAVLVEEAPKGPPTYADMLKVKPEATGPSKTQEK